MKKVFKKENIKEIAGEIISKISKIKNDKAIIVTLSGDLGAGKTTLTKEIAKQLGVKGTIISPTFVIMKIYKTKNSKFKKLIHLDAYRLNSDEELLKIGWSELIENKDSLILIEWPERVSGCFDDSQFKIEIFHIDNETRTIIF